MWAGSSFDMVERDTWLGDYACKYVCPKELERH